MDKPYYQSLYNEAVELQKFINNGVTIGNAILIVQNRMIFEQMEQAIKRLTDFSKN